MSRAARPPFETLADVLKQLGGIDPSRVRADVPLGKATEHDLVRLLDRSQRLYELVDGVLVEKTMGFPESFAAWWWIPAISKATTPNNVPSRLAQSMDCQRLSN